MSSIFTYDPSPAQPSSPWTHPRNSHPPGKAASHTAGDHAEHKDPELVGTKGLMSEPQAGSTEYKLHLLKEGKSSMRIEQLTTQLLWRLQQSSSFCPSTPSGSLSSTPQQIRNSLQDSQGALYELGVADDGTFIGLLEDELNESLDTLRSMAAKLGCGVWILRKVAVGKLTEQQARSVAPVGFGEWDDREDMGRRRQGKSGTLWVAEAFVKPIIGVTRSGHEVSVGEGEGDDGSTPRVEQLRISVTGTTTSGKSTLLGTLTTSKKDNGRGKSRLSLFRHRHEFVSGLTSSVAQEIVGYRPYALDNSGGEVVNYSSDNISSWADIHTAASTKSNIHTDSSDTISFENGRIVFLSDTPGHLRYRRTMIRSLVGWAPHYAIVLIPADDEELSKVTKNHLHLVLKLDLRMIVLITKLDIARKAAMRNILSDALTILKGNGRVAKTLNAKASDIGHWSVEEERRVRSIVKEMEELDSRERGAGKAIVPILFTSSVTGQGVGCLHALLRALPIPKELPCRKYAENLTSFCETSLLEITGGMHEVAGIGKRDVRESNYVEPVPAKDPFPGAKGGVVEWSQRQPAKTLFQIEEVYELHHQYAFFPEMQSAHNDGVQGPPGAIVSGYLKRGKVSIGDELLIGPFPLYAVASGKAENTIGITRPYSEPRSQIKRDKDLTSTTPISSSSLLMVTSAVKKAGWLSGEDPMGASSGDELTFNKLFKNKENHYSLHSLSSLSAANRGNNKSKGDLTCFGKKQTSETQPQDEWVVVRVVSVRRLRLPVTTLFEDEVGTIGIVRVRGTNERQANDVKIAIAPLPLTNVEGSNFTATNRAWTAMTNPYINEQASNANGLVSTPNNTTISSTHSFLIRRGMVVLSLPASNRAQLQSTTGIRPVLAMPWPQSCSSFTAFFDLSDQYPSKYMLTIGTDVLVYISSIRAVARVIDVRIPTAAASISSARNKITKIPSKNQDMDAFNFSFESDEAKEVEVAEENKQEVYVTFKFLKYDEWIESGEKVLIMGGQGRSDAALDGTVGRIVRVVAGWERRNYYHVMNQ